jgi:hypothetical protein
MFKIAIVPRAEVDFQFPNLIAYTGNASYGYPRIQKVLEWE